jgi:hypothetical protein
MGIMKVLVHPFFTKVYGNRRVVLGPSRCQIAVANSTSLDYKMTLLALSLPLRNDSGCKGPQMVPSTQEILAKVSWNRENVGLPC